MSDCSVNTFSVKVRVLWFPGFVVCDLPAFHLSPICARPILDPSTTLSLLCDRTIVHFTMSSLHAGTIADVEPSVFESLVTPRLVKEAQRQEEEGRRTFRIRKAKRQALEASRTQGGSKSGKQRELRSQSFTGQFENPRAALCRPYFPSQCPQISYSIIIKWMVQLQSVSTITLYKTMNQAPKNHRQTQSRPRNSEYAVQTRSQRDQAPATRF